MGSGKTIDIWVHKGAGAYICGEETAMMNSLEGKRGNPRIKPPFPAVSGVFGMPTTINNVETLAAVPPIINQGAAWYKKFARADNPKSTGTKLCSVCGNVQRPGNYEVAMGFPFKDFLYELCGGPHPGRRSSRRSSPAASRSRSRHGGSRGLAHGLRGHRRAGHDARLRRRHRHGRRAEPGEVIARAARFYAHESCAQCTQCREGTAWTTKILERIAAGDGSSEDLDTLLSIADNMTGKTICVLSDSCATPVVSGLRSSARSSRR